VHLFLHCDFTVKVWASVMRWLDFSLITPLNFFVHWASWSNEGRNKKIRKGLWIIWHATIWSIWQARNHIIFWNEVKYVDVLLSDIMVLSWRWSLTRLTMQTCLYYEWSWNPLECLRRQRWFFVLLVGVCVSLGSLCPCGCGFLVLLFFCYFQVVCGLVFCFG